jgi:hypothetical protein
MCVDFLVVLFVLSCPFICYLVLHISSLNITYNNRLAFYKVNIFLVFVCWYIPFNCIRIYTRLVSLFHSRMNGSCTRARCGTRTLSRKPWSRCLVTNNARPWRRTSLMTRFVPTCIRTRERSRSYLYIQRRKTNTLRHISSARWWRQSCQQTKRFVYTFKVMLKFV